MVGAVDMLRPQKGPVRKSRLVCIVNEQSVLGALNDPKGENSNLAFSLDLILIIQVLLSSIYPVEIGLSHQAHLIIYSQHTISACHPSWQYAGFEIQAAAIANGTTHF